MTASPIVKYGVANPDEVAGLTGLEILQAMIEGRLPAPPMARTLTFWLTEVGDGLAVFEGEPGEAFLNPMGGVHGGWALTLIDSACGCAGMTTLPPGARYASLETKAQFQPPDHQGHRPRAMRGPRRLPGPADHFDRRQSAFARRQGARPRHVDADGVRGEVTPIAIKRVYEPAREADGTRVLVDRLWPRGISKDQGRIDLWLKAVAPSDALRKRFHGKPEDWKAFCEAYFDELKSPASEAAATRLIDLLRNGPATLLNAARDEAHKNAVALRMWLEKQVGSPHKRRE